MPLSYSVILSVVFGPLAAGYLGASLFGSRRNLPSIPGLLFHSILPTPGLNMSHFSSSKFRIILQSLAKQHFKSIRLSEAVNSIQKPSNKYLITFDDGMECVYTHALPLMSELEVKSTIFCIPGFTGKSSSWDVFKGQKHLSVDQIKKLAECGHEIGSHSFSHANLIFLNDKDLQKELRDSKKYLEDIIGKEVKSLSFPYGSWNKRVWEKSIEAGYCSATLYRNHISNQKGLYPVYGVYRFDTPETVINRLKVQQFSLSIAMAKIMSHFSKGTPIVNFRKNYIIK